MIVFPFEKKNPSVERNKYSVKFSLFDEVFDYEHVCDWLNDCDYVYDYVDYDDESVLNHIIDCHKIVHMSHQH